MPAGPSFKILLLAHGMNSLQVSLSSKRPFMIPNINLFHLEIDSCKSRHVLIKKKKGGKRYKSYLLKVIRSSDCFWMTIC